MQHREDHEDAQAGRGRDLIETDAEGKLGVSQSIPFLAFWGNWTDSSMFDTSVYAEDRFNEMPHKYLNIARENYYNVKKAGSGNTFNLGVNLYANDDAFLADRTAVRAGDTLMTINYNLIRNAQDVSYVIRNAETGEVYFSKDYGKQSAPSTIRTAAPGPTPRRRRASAGGLRTTRAMRSRTTRSSSSS